MDKLNKRRLQKLGKGLSHKSQRLTGNSLLLSGNDSINIMDDYDEGILRAPIEKEEIKKVVITITLESDSEKDDSKALKLEECIVCFQDSFCFGLPCGHKTCGKCRKKWKRISNTCPVCRKIIH